MAYTFTIKFSLAYLLHGLINASTNNSSIPFYYIGSTMGGAMSKNTTNGGKGENYCTSLKFIGGTVPGHYSGSGSPNTISVKILLNGSTIATGSGTTTLSINSSSLINNPTNAWSGLTVQCSKPDNYYSFNSGSNCYLQYSFSYPEDQLKGQLIKPLHFDQTNLISFLRTFTGIQRSNNGTSAGAMDSGTIAYTPWIYGHHNMSPDYNFYGTAGNKILATDLVNIFNGKTVTIND